MVEFSGVLKHRIYAKIRVSAAEHVIAPNTGTEWITIPDSEIETPNYYSATAFTDVPSDHPILGNLPFNCYEFQNVAAMYAYPGMQIDFLVE